MPAVQQLIETRDLTIKGPHILEGGDLLPEITVRYTSLGTLSPKKDNVVWVFHALTGSSDVSDWWSGLVGQDGLFDPERDFIICANVLGSCYGTTGPDDYSFPFVTIKDIVKTHQILRDHLQIEQAKVGIGGSLGGQQLLEWAVQEPDFFQNLIPIATNAAHSPWGIAFNEAQRMALKNPDQEKGIEAARAIAMLSYRNYQTFEQKQKDVDQRWDHFSASAYVEYQGQKLRKRFTPFSYFTLSKAMDSHNIGRYYYNIELALSRIRSKTLVLGIDTDILFPIEEQRTIQEYIPGAKLEILESIYGHDAFLIETERINAIIKNFLQ